MARYTVKLMQREDIAEGTMAFHFEKPTNFQFQAGQYFLVTLVNPPETDAKGNDRVFSIASAPYEPTLMVATRMRDTAFKRVLKAMPLGSTVEIQSPAGKLVLHGDDARPVVLLMGGIGITPARSILLQATRDHWPQRLFLFYSNRRPEDAAFLDELTQLAQENHRYTFVGTMTDIAKTTRPWHGETGYINKALIARHLVGLSAPIYYIAGPPAMVTAMRTLLREANVSNEHICVEEFAGY